MRALVTGAQGFVGRYLTARLLEDGNSVVLGIGRSPQRPDTFTHGIRLGERTVDAPLPKPLAEALQDKRYTYARVDLQEPATVVRIIEDFRPEAIYHMASGLRDDAPGHLVRTNVEGTLALLQAVSKTRVQPRAIVLGSTGGIYGIPASVPIAEDAPGNPVDMYSASKLASEHLSRIAARTDGLPVLWARLFNLTGPGQDERHVLGRFASQLAAIARGAAPPELHVGDLSTTRDFIDVRDIADALLLLAERGEAGTAYNVASGVEARIDAVLDALLDVAGLNERVQVRKSYDRPADIPRHVADVRRIGALGFRTRVSLRESAAAVYEYYLDAFARSCASSRV